MALNAASVAPYPPELVNVIIHRFDGQTIIWEADRDLAAGQTVAQTVFAKAG